MSVKLNRTAQTATAFLAVAFVLVSCGKGKLREADKIDLDSTPVQVARGMFAVQTKDGQVLQRMEAPMMQRFSTDTLDYELFPEGISVYAYTQDGLLETIITANSARHTTASKKSKGEKWEAFGNVVIHNAIKRQTMETDTIYWDRKAEEIYTDCYVKLFSDQGMMQGYGMRSDDRARNAILLNTFDGYGYTQEDTSTVVIDSINFIGPLL